MKTSIDLLLQALRDEAIAQHKKYCYTNDMVRETIYLGISDALGSVATRFAKLAAEDEALEVARLNVGDLS